MNSSKEYPIFFPDYLFIPPNQPKNLYYKNKNKNNQQHNTTNKPSQVLTNKLPNYSNSLVFKMSRPK